MDKAVPLPLTAPMAPLPAKVITSGILLFESQAEANRPAIKSRGNDFLMKGLWSN
jgi:hypothetical protein